MADQQKLLIDSAETIAILSISRDDLDWLVDTQQLSPINIRGQRLFELSQLKERVVTYKTVQSRGSK
jgi:hypothetical protein